MAGYVHPSHASDGLSRPPHTVRIKRKKHEEPVDSLYIQVEPEQKKRRFSDFVFRRVSTDGERGKSREWQPGQNTLGLNARHTEDPGVAWQSPAQSDANRTDVDQPTSETPLDAENIHSLPDHNGMSNSDSDGRQSSLYDAFKTPAMAHARRFHLAKSAMDFPQSPAGGVRKSKRAGKPSVALLFEEIKSKTKEPSARKETGQDAIVEQSSGVTLSPRKRPNTRRGKTTSRAGESEGAPEKDPVFGGPTDPGPTKFSELPDWAQDLLRKELGSARFAGGASPQKPLKIKPTAPALRYRDRHLDHSDEMTHAPLYEISRGLEDDTEYVYDTYVREPRQSALNEENIGVLVVDDETQTAWEAAEDTEFSDEGEGDEEEDENAENYYANDYPEEEEEGGAYSEDEDGGGDEDEESDMEGRQWRMYHPNHDDGEAHWSGDDDDDNDGLYPQRYWKPLKYH